MSQNRSVFIGDGFPNESGSIGKNAGKYGSRERVMVSIRPGDMFHYTKSGKIAVTNNDQRKGMDKFEIGDHVLFIDDNRIGLVNGIYSNKHTGEKYFYVLFDGNNDGKHEPIKGDRLRRVRKFLMTSDFKNTMEELAEKVNPREEEIVTREDPKKEDSEMNKDYQSAHTFHVGDVVKFYDPKSYASYCNRDRKSRLVKIKHVSDPISVVEDVKTGRVLSAHVDHLEHLSVHPVNLPEEDEEITPCGHCGRAAENFTRFDPINNRFDNFCNDCMRTVERQCERKRALLACHEDAETIRAVRGSKKKGWIRSKLPSLRSLVPSKKVCVICAAAAGTAYLAITYVPMLF